MSTGPQPPDALPGRPRPLGATPGPDGTSFAVWAPGAEAVDLCLFDDRGREERVRLAERTHGVHHGLVPGVGHGRRYGFRAHGRWDPWHGERRNPRKLLLDPYARAVDGRFVLDDAVFGHVRASGDDTLRDERDSAPFVPRSVVVDDPYDWGDDRPPAVPWEETVVYEAHVRGFTMLHPGVPQGLRGSYAGLAHPAAVQHLVDLGVTTVELLPVHEHVSEEHLLAGGRVNYWGYNSVGFFAPHSGYSASGTRGQQVREFRDMVRALHAAGLEVVLDVVYNHTAEASETGPTLLFRGLENAGYYRLRDGRHYTDLTGCGNTVDTTSPAALALVMDSLRYWVEEMHVDGFRFDLVSAIARGPQAFSRASAFLTAVGQDPVLSRAKLVAEPWDLGEGGYQVGAFPPPWAEWNDKYRGTVRDLWRGRSDGVREVAYRLTGSSDVFGGPDDRRPYASVNFVTAHDGFTLRDLVSYDRKHNLANGEDDRDGTDDNRSWNCGVEGPTDDPEVLALRARQSRNLLATLLLSAGTPMITAGDEMGRTQGGNNNAYCQDNEVSWLDWDLDAEQRSLLGFTRLLLRLRREHVVLRQPRFFAGAPLEDGGRKDLAWFRRDGREMDHAAWFDPGLRTLGMLLGGDAMPLRDARGERIVDDSFLLLLNAGAEPVEFTLPGAPWALSGYDVVLDTAAPDVALAYPAGATVPMAGRSLVLLRAS
ncbi:glycogen debranching protein GlgX [Vallicoccus soli]|uniref:glycogen debranching protein GlgX n=1 Tax=Vallicoccus soli TaxID=2339232 RepID=UPI001C49C1FF|nr:glycogen debranching protein GlgX [Vallicoccus soli]